MPNNSFSDVVVSGEKRGFYIGTQYKVGVPNFSDFSAAETIPGLTVGIFALDYDAADITKSSSFTRAYDPTYASSFNGFSGVMGCYFNNIRVEFEGSYSSFEPERQFYPEGSNSYKFFALSRGRDSVQDKKFVVLENNGVIDRALNVNFCYDVTGGSVPLSPYVCAGVGADYIKFLGISLPKFSYQVKFGVNYPVSGSVILFGGGYYHKVIGSKYERVEVAHHPAIEEPPKITSASANLSTGYFGWEVGIRFAL
ncbi:MAG: P44/Msp2 family outer membrane protein [Ehrlichia sp.]